MASHAKLRSQLQGLVASVDHPQAKQHMQDAIDALSTTPPQGRSTPGSKQAVAAAGRPVGKGVDAKASPMFQGAAQRLARRAKNLTRP